MMRYRQHVGAAVGAVAGYSECWFMPLVLLFLLQKINAISNSLAQNYTAAYKKYIAVIIDYLLMQKEMDKP